MYILLCNVSIKEYSLRKNALIVSDCQGNYLHCDAVIAIQCGFLNALQVLQRLRSIVLRAVVPLLCPVLVLFTV